MHFLLFSMSVVYVLTTHIPKDSENATMEQIRKRAKWDNDDYVCRCLILNGMSDFLFDIYQNVKSFKELYDSLEAQYMAEDASSKKFIVSNFTNYKMTDSRPVMKQYNKLLGILGRFTQHKMNIDEDELTLVELDSHLRIEESLKVQDSDKPKGKMLLVLQLSIWWSITTPPGVNVGNKANSLGTKVSVDGSSNSLKGQNMFNESFHVYYVTYISEAYFVHDDDVAWWVDSRVTVHVCKDRCWFKTHESLNDGSILHMRNESTALVHGRGCVDLKFSSKKIVSLFNVLLNIVNDNIASAFMSTFKLNDSILWHARLGYVYFKRMQDMSKNELIPAFDMNTKKCERGIKCIFVGYAEHTKAFRFYVIEPNESISINLIIESRDAIFDENRFSSVSRPSLRIPNRNEDTGGSVVFEEVTKEVVQQPEPELKKNDPKTFVKAMKSQNIALSKETINNEMNFIMGNNTWVLAGLPPGCKL
nr:zinc finger, CCHC-type [Tanacetum cinerariifolium]